MCANYVPVTSGDHMLTHFGVERDFKNELPPEAWPLGFAPFIRKVPPGGVGTRVVEAGMFGLLPGFAKDLAYGRRTYNARTETVHELPSFREAWRKGWRCIIPALAIYEPNYESGKAERWMIHQPGAVPMGLAGIYRAWRGPDGRELFTFAMLTVNADDHAFYRRFHKPGDEKRMVVILHPGDYDRWLECEVEEAPQFFRQWHGALEGYAKPLPPRAPKATSGKVIAPRDPGLF